MAIPLFVIHNTKHNWEAPQVGFPPRVKAHHTTAGLPVFALFAGFSLSKPPMKPPQDSDPIHPSQFAPCLVRSTCLI